MLRDIAEDIVSLVEEKKLEYGDSVGNVQKIMEILCPTGISKRAYGDVLLLVRILDKISRIVTMSQDIEESTEKIKENWSDIAGYALRALERL